DCGQCQTQKDYYAIDTHGRIIRSMAWGEFMASNGGWCPWHFGFDPNGSWTNMEGFKGLSRYIAALPNGQLTDAATLFSSYTDSNTATTSDSRLQAIGRQTPTFAILRVLNTTGSCMRILRDNGTPTPLNGTATIK